MAVSFNASRLRRAGQEDSWVEISSQPSSSSLSSANDELLSPSIHTSNRRRRPSRTTGQARPASLLRNDTTSSQEEYEESESESDQIMTSSNEGWTGGHISNGPSRLRNVMQADRGYQSSDNEDGNRTAINYPISRADANTCFTPQPNAFNRPTTQSEPRFQSVPGSYFPASRSPPKHAVRPYSSHQAHAPHNILSPSYSPALHHEENLRNSLNTLLSCAAAARALPKAGPEPQLSTLQNATLLQRGTRPTQSTSSGSPAIAHEPSFQPTLRRLSTSTSASSHGNKRIAAQIRTRSVSRERRLTKKQRQSSSENLSTVSPTLTTWMVSAGVVVILGALSFTAGYQMGREVGKIEGAELISLSASPDEKLLSCARDVGRSSLGLRRSLASSAIAV